MYGWVERLADPVILLLLSPVLGACGGGESFDNLA
jgi:hypothetical protein